MALDKRADAKVLVKIAKLIGPRMVKQIRRRDRKVGRQEKVVESRVRLDKTCMM
jgi:hypothetical protein